MNKTEILNILKKNGYGNIDSDKKGSYHSINAIPYRDRDGKIIKGISLYRTSPVTFTNVGYERGVKIVDDIINEFSQIGKVKRLSESPRKISVMVSFMTKPFIFFHLI